MQEHNPVRCLDMPGTDLEINATMVPEGLVLWVSKSDVPICRGLLENADAKLDAGTLADFATFAPGIAFRVGDNIEGIERLKRSLGMA